MEMFQKEAVLARSSSFIQAMSLLMIIIISLLFVYLFAIVAAMPFWGSDVLNLMSGSTESFDEPGVVSLMKYIQVISQIGLFVIPSVAFAYLVHRKVFDYLKLNVGFSLPQLIISVVIIYISLPFFSWLGALNQQMVLPEFLSGVEEWMKSTEESAAQQISAFLNVKTIWGILFNLFMIALIPGIGEELLFRGVLIRLFKNWFGNIHLAILISSILFSALHMQFYGFLPRFALGMLLGYTFVWTSSLWIPIILHFLNNASILIFFYAQRSTEVAEKNIESFGSSDSIIVIILSTFSTAFLLYYLYQQKKFRES